MATSAKDPLSMRRCCGRRLQATWGEGSQAIWKCRSCHSVHGPRLTRPIGARRIAASRVAEPVARRRGQERAVESQPREPRVPIVPADVSARSRARVSALAEVLRAIESAKSSGRL